MTTVRRLKAGEGTLMRELRVASPARHAMFVAEDGTCPVGLAFGLRRDEGTADLPSNTALAILQMRLGFGNAAR